MIKGYPFHRILIFLVLLAFVCTAKKVKGQVEVLMGIEIVIPQEELKDVALIGIGGTGGLEIPVTKKMGLTGQIGFIYLRPQDEFDSAFLFPIQAGYKFAFNSKEKGIYLHTKFGIHTLKATKKPPSGPVFFNPAENFSSSSMSYGFGLGYVANKEIDIEIRYNIISKDEIGNYFGIRLGFSII